MAPFRGHAFHHGRGPGAAVPADVQLACPLVNGAELPRIHSPVTGDRPGSAGLSPAKSAVPSAAVRPAEDHSEVHPGHIALAAAAVLVAGMWGCHLLLWPRSRRTLGVRSRGVRFSSMILYRYCIILTINMLLILKGGCLPHRFIGLTCETT